MHSIKQQRIYDCIIFSILTVGILQVTLVNSVNKTVVVTTSLNREIYEDNYANTVNTTNGDEKDSMEELQQRLEKARIRYLLLDRTCAMLNKPKLKVRFVFTKAFVENGQSESQNCWVELQNNGKVPERVWRPEGDIKMLIHGFMPRVWDDPDEMMNNQRIFEMGEEYGHHNESLNVLAVDWTFLSATLAYSHAAFSTRHVGINVAGFLLRLHSRNNLTVKDWDRFHLIGASEGAIVSGIAGHQLEQLGAVKMGRITGIDPAGPEFDGPNGTFPQDMSAFLDKSDAKFVDIIHCNMGRAPNWIMASAQGRYGSWVQAGNADFYPNGGEEQSFYCSGIQNRLGCSHTMCLKYFINSIHKKNYLACRCDSWERFKNVKCSPCQQNGEEGTLMGDRCNKTAFGKYYLSIGGNRVKMTNRTKLKKNRKHKKKTDNTTVKIK